MSVVRKQGVYNSLINYLGVAIGFIATLFVYNLDRELYGFTQFLTSTSLFLIPFMTLGITSLVLKYYPEFEKRYPERNFLISILIMVVLSTGVFIVLFLIFRRQFFDLLNFLKVDQMFILRTYAKYVVLLGFILAIVRILTLQASNLRKIVIPEIVRNLSYKIFLPTIILLAISGYLDKRSLCIAIIIFYASVAVFLAIYVYSLKSKKPHPISWKELPKQKQKEIREFTFFSALNSLSASFAFRIDMIMLTAMLGFASNGVYAIVLFLTNIIDIPRRSLSKILSPVLSTASSENDIEEINRLYKKASIFLLAPCLAMFLLLYAVFPELDKIAAGDSIFWENRYLFLFIAVGRLIDVIFSMNTEIITYSKFFKYNLIFILILAAANVLMNYFWIQEYGILGSAMATLGAFLIYNLLKGWFIYKNLGIHPFQSKLLILIGLGLVCFIVLSCFPISLPFIFSTIVKGLVILLMYVLPVYFLKITPDINTMVDNNLRKIFKRT